MLIGSNERRCEYKAGEYSGSDDYHFRAGTYSGYNAWRNELSLMANGVSAEQLWNEREKRQGAPFYELIDFSDCDGAIGAKVSATLLRDFKQHRAKIHKKMTELHGEQHAARFFYVYVEFTQALEIASDRACLYSHNLKTDWIEASAPFFGPLSRA